MDVENSQRADKDHFYYPQLRDANENIRVLWYNGLSDDDMLTFGMEEVILDEVTLDERDSYLALSYEWREEDSTEAILVDGCRFMVRPNLYDFLERNLDRLWHTPIFIDAICINQADVKEKQAQIALMGRVYSQATEVLAWLGTRPKLFPDGLEWRRIVDDYDEIRSLSLKRALRSEALAAVPRDALRHDDVPPVVASMMADLHDEWGYKMAIACRNVMDGALGEVGDLSKELISMDTLDFDLCRMYFTSSFWTRCWIVQELALGQKLTLQLGDLSVSPEVYLLLTYTMLPQETPFRWAFNEHLLRPTHAHLMLDLPIMATQHYHEDSMLLLGTKARKILQVRQVCQSELQHGGRISLREAMEKTCEQRCTMPHDHLYSLLGITNTDVTVDYRRDLLLLYIYVLLECLHEDFNEKKPPPPNPRNHLANTIRICLLVFRLSMRHSSTWIVTSQMIRLVVPDRSWRACLHVALPFVQAFNDRPAGSVADRFPFIHDTLILPPLTLSKEIKSYAAHKIRQWRDKKVRGLEADSKALTYAEWAEVVARVYELVQRGEPLKWTRACDVLYSEH